MAAPSAIEPTSGPAFSPAAIPGSTAATGGGTVLLATPISTPKGFCLAFNDPVMAENPAWTWIDDPAGSYKVQRWTIDRGRSYELDRTGTGTATVTVFDTTGAFDPTNTTGVFYGLLEPLKQAALALYNPVAATWSTVFRGFVADWDYVVHPTEKYLGVEIRLVDALDLLAAAELVPDGTFGDGVLNGDITYNQDLTTDAVQTRINKVLTEVGWPAGLRSVFTGNVKLQAAPYPPRATALSVILDASDAEHPVANVWVGRTGKVSFRGRLARFNPTDVRYGITTWLVGDTAAVDAAPSTVAPIVPPLQFQRDKENVFTAAIATPQNVADGDIAAQFVKDAAAVAGMGPRTWSAENLLTGGGASTTALVETKKFATYIITNYQAPLTRVNQLTFKAQRPSGWGAATSWLLVCNVEIGDRIQLTTTHVGGGGFAGAYFFVEGVHYQVNPLNPTHHDVTVTLDVSPVGYYASNPF